MISRIGAVVERSSSDIERVDILEAEVRRNGSRRIDSATIKFPTGTKVDINDKVSYIQDEVSIEDLTAIWNFQGSWRDEGGFHHNGYINRTLNGVSTTWVDVGEDSNFVSPNGVGNSLKFRANYGATFTAAGQEIRVNDDTRFDFSQQFDIIIFFKNQTNTTSGDHWNTSTDTQILFAKHDGTDGVEIGIKLVSGSWKVYAKLNSTTFTGAGDLISDGNDHGKIDDGDTGNVRMIRFYRDSDDLVKLTLDGHMDGTDSGECRQTVVSSQSSTRTTEKLYFGTNKANVTNSPSGSEDNYDFMGHIFQVRVYCGGYLTDGDTELLLTTGAQQMTQKISGVVWQKKDKLKNVEVEVLSRAKTLLQSQLRQSGGQGSTSGQAFDSNHSSVNDTDPAIHNRNLYAIDQEIRKILQSIVYQIDPEFLFRRFGSNTQSIDGGYLAVGGFIPNVEVLMLYANQQFLTLPTKTFLYEYGDGNNNMISGYSFDSKDYLMFDRGEDDTKLVNDLEIYGDILLARASPRNMGGKPASAPHTFSTKFIAPPIGQVTIAAGDSSAPSTDPDDEFVNDDYSINENTRELTLKSGGFAKISAGGFCWAKQYSYEIIDGTSVGFGGGDDTRHEIREETTSIATYGRHSRRIYIPQLLKQGAFQRFAQVYLGEWKDKKRRYTIVAPFLLNCIRENHIVELTSDSMKFPDSGGTLQTSTDETVRSITWRYPEMTTTIEVGDYMYDSFDLTKRQADNTSHLLVGAYKTRVTTA